MNIPTDLPTSGTPAPQSLLDAHTYGELKAQTIENVRKHPSNARERWLLFELLCLDGEWERALRQLQTWATLEPEGTSRAQMYRSLIRSEMFRTEVFAGQRMPGEIDPLPAWVHSLLQANVKLGEGNLAAADELRRAALDAAPPTRGESTQIGEFEWLTDSDSRLGPVCELTVAGGYRWVPFGSMKSLTLGPVTALTDLVWRSAVVGLRDATVLRGYLSVRYPGSESGPFAIRLSRKTTWKDVGETGVIALGQKTWTTNKGDFGMLEIGECRFNYDERP
ncbi:ImpE protein superfamily protein [Paraburkholderia sp. MMS20-SJTN17]|uniref:ImpE protein superfamily protein n=1 Tax=Paraburkholderia translucens TaxID=2886945 RepID=A0ABS8KCT3_9BURK|nr:type VI secretion system accessory protein TagJ [Paraburkholderia sp. MMS20-SJTN17]MCC8402571.1 ImpE protein superfamily protein [Paraburkholderia sp. MMS20-SJTN17]